MKKNTTICKGCGYTMALAPGDDPSGDWRCMPCGMDQAMGRPSRRLAEKLRKEATK